MSTEVREVKLSDIVFDKLIYPRVGGHIPAKVGEYAENMEAIEAAGNYITVSAGMRLLDGRHRHLAYMKIHDSDLDAMVKVFVRSDVQTQQDEILAGIDYNNDHGQQLSRDDKKDRAFVLYRDGTWLEKNEIAKRLSVSISTVHNWLSDTDRRLKEQRDQKIFDMWLACHTQEEIAEAVDSGRKTISDQIATFGGFSNCGKSAKSAKNHDADNSFAPPLYNVWSFAKKTNDVSHFGNTEQRIVDNLLYLYTEPFDIVLDPFGGGGSTIDVCKKRLRRYWVSDRKPIVERAHEIRDLDIVIDLPLLNRNWSNVTLTYLDPPYWKQAENKYSNDPEDLANMPLDQFTESMVDIVKRIASKQSKGYIALIIQPTQWKSDNREFTDHVLDIINGVGNKRLILENRVSCPYSTEQYNAQQVEWAKENKKLLVISRELIVWRIAA